MKSPGDLEMSEGSCFISQVFSSSALLLRVFGLFPSKVERWFGSKLGYRCLFSKRKVWSGFL